LIDGSGAEAAELPPHNLEAETGALSAILSLPADASIEADNMLGQLSPGMFYSLPRRNLYHELFAMRQDGLLLHVSVISEWLVSKKVVQECGGLESLLAMADSGVSIHLWGHWLGILREYRFRRLALEESAKLAKLARATECTPADIKASLAKMSERATGIAEAGGRLIELITPKEAREYVPDPKMFLVGAGIISLGEVFVLAGWQGVGKSMAATALAAAGARGGNAEWMGYQIRRRWRTLILQSENSQDRLASEYRAVGVDVDGWVKMSKPLYFQFSRPEFRRELLSIWEQWPYDMLILDNWLDITTEGDSKDHLEALDQIRASLPGGDSRPAVGILAHLRKQRGGENWIPKTGRALVHEVSGSLVITAKARTVFVFQPASLDPQDQRVIMDVGKCNNGAPLPMSAWQRSMGAFRPLPDFDFKAWMNPVQGEKPKSICREILYAVFGNGEEVLLTKSQAVAKLKELGFSPATAYRALDLEGGPFRHCLKEAAGFLRWSEE
jgi:CheY-like chemotaxis protein